MPAPVLSRNQNRLRPSSRGRIPLAAETGHFSQKGPHTIVMIGPDGPGAVQIHCCRAETARIMEEITHLSRLNSIGPVRTHSLVIALVFLTAPPLAVAEEAFVLEGGGTIRGELLNQDQVPRTEYIVRTVEGVVFKLDRTQVVEKDYRRPEEVEYERIWPSFADTVEDQWKLAEWCRERTLTEQRENHLKRIVHLDPDHEEARRALGYMRRNGRWTTPDDQYRRRGYVHYEGQWRTAQEIQLIEEARNRKSVEDEWLKKLKTYRDQLASGNGAAEARKAILEIRDPGAIRALGQALVDEPNPIVRELYLDALGNLGTGPAAMTLALAYRNEPVDELRYTCLDHLKGKHVATDYFVGLLHDKDSDVVNSAGFALGYLEDPSAIAPLIGALVTHHKQRIKQGDPNQMSTGFDSRGNVGFGAGGSDMIVTVNSHNRAVLDALAKLTGKNFGFDIGLWKSWHAAQRRYEHINPRRD